MPFCHPPKICPVCLEPSQTKFVRNYRSQDGVFSLYECLSCLIQFWEPFVNPGAVWYEAQEIYRLKKPKLYRGYHKSFLRSFPSFLAGTKLLDIGCGTGEFLNEVNQKGVQCWGVDSDTIDIQTAQEYFGLLNLYTMPFDDFFNIDALPQFDFITFFEVLEHLDNPLKFITNVKKILKPSGRIVLSVPFRGRMFVDAYEWDFPPYHLSRWNESAIARLFRKIDFKICSINYADEYIHFHELIFGLRQRIGKRIKPKKAGELFGNFFPVKLPALILWAGAKIMRKKNGVMVITLERGKI